MKLFENGKSAFAIVTAKDAPKLTARSALEIQAAVKACGNVELPIVEAWNGPAIVLGGADARLAGGRFDEDYVIDIDEKGVRIAGSGLRGTLYGAYTFLEKVLGVRYFTARDAYYPKRDSLEMAELYLYDKPDIAVRRMPFKCVEGVVFGGRCRFNELTDDPALEKDPEYGRGDYEYALGHSIHKMVPDALFDAHPEYFPEIDGVRRHGPCHQRCLTDPDVLEMMVAEVRRVLRGNPLQTSIAVAQADTYPSVPNNCTCAACRAIDEAEGSPMGTLLRFVNAVAERIEGEFPHVMITTLAYRYTRKPPRITKPRDNVAVMLCSIECCFSHPIDADCGADFVDGPAGKAGNAEFVEDIESWSRIAKNLMIWDYVIDFLHYLAPHPNLCCIGPNVRFFKAHNACGIYPEGAPDSLGVEMDECRSYMLSKLLWHCGTDEKVDRDEFLIGKLGVAAAPVMRAIDLFEAHVRKENIHMSTYHTPDERAYPEELVKKWDALMDRAEKTAPDEKAREYVERIRMSVRYVKLCLYTRGDDDARRRIGETFLSDMQRLGIGMLMDSADEERVRERVFALLKLKAR